MSVEYTVLECAQAAAVSGTPSNWTNVVNRSGIDLLPGDQINMEMAALHAQGSDGDTVEITGDQTDLLVVDNKAIMDWEYWISHCGRNTARLPFRNSRTYLGGGAAQPATPAPHTLLDLRCRKLGLPNLEYDRLHPPSFDSVEMPSKQYSMRVYLDNAPGYNYSAGQEYVLRLIDVASTTRIAVDASDDLMRITINTTREIPGTKSGKDGTPTYDGGVSTFTVTHLGSYDYSPRSSSAQKAALVMWSIETRP
jgi:hypothetical protein